MKYTLAFMNFSNENETQRAEILEPFLNLVKTPSSPLSKFKVNLLFQEYRLENKHVF